VKTIGVVTSGGDAPGMNAAIRGVVRLASSRDSAVLGFERGWEGLMTNKFRPLTSRSVGGIVHLGGTILHTARSSGFRTDEGIKTAARTLALNGIDSLVVIGGDGSMRGAFALSRKTDTSIIGVPSSIDNDVFGTDETIGFDTAVNTAVDEIDKIRDTAVSLDRTFIIQVMGRTRGFLALTVGVTVGAEVILVPELDHESTDIVRTLKEAKEKGKNSAIIVAAEGVGSTRELADSIERTTGGEVRLSVLGYTQRGGHPSARSRLLASLFAEEAVELLSRGKRNRVVGLQSGKITSVGLDESCAAQKPLDLELMKLAKRLAA
jgi:6-phosphofructokinase 1